MKKLMTLAIVAMMSSSSYAIMVGSGNNMGQEPLPRAARDTNASMTDTNRRNYDVDTTRNDTISTGQSATRRNTNSSVSNQSASSCVDKSGYTYYKNDSGYAACVNQSSSKMRSR